MENFNFIEKYKWEGNDRKLKISRFVLAQYDRET